WRKFLLDNSIFLKHRVGDDPMYLEKADIAALRKLQEWSYWGIKTVDALTAGAVLGGAYMKYLHDNNIELDMDNPNKDAMDYANRVMRATQGSTVFMHLPAALSTSKYRWLIKIVTMF